MFLTIYVCGNLIDMLKALSLMLLLSLAILDINHWAGNVFFHLRVRSGT